MRVPYDSPLAMSQRTVGIWPETRYDFRPNANYRHPWNFLPNERAKVIAEHLTYLEFHEWLMDNLRHATQHDPEPSDWSQLVSSVAEGFFKTDVLLYASICEAALYTVLDLVHSHEGARAHQAVKDCFRTIKDCFHKISKYEASMNIQGNVTGELCLRLSREEPVSEPKFTSLIRAGKAIGIYDANFEQRLDRLRNERNTIHLANQIERREFNNRDRTRAKKITEDLRVRLRDFVESQPWAP
jgi:hypothetical protein